MTAGPLDLVIEQYATFSKVLTYRDAAGALVNLTGYNAVAQFRSAFGTPDVLFELSVANGRLVLGGAAGTITMTITDELTATLTWSAPVVWDLVLTPPSGVAERLVQGSVTLQPGVTHA